MKNRKVRYFLLGWPRYLVLFTLSIVFLLNVFYWGYSNAVAQGLLLLLIVNGMLSTWAQSTQDKIVSYLSDRLGQVPTEEYLIGFNDDLAFMSTSELNAYTTNYMNNKTNHKERFLELYSNSDFRTIDEEFPDYFRPYL